MRTFKKGKTLANKDFEKGYFRSYKEYSEGDMIQAVLEGSYIGNEYKGKKPTNYRVRVFAYNFEFKDFKSGTVVDLTDKILILNGQKVVGAAMEELGEGGIFELTYGGKKPSASGDTYHAFDITALEEDDSEEEDEL